MSKASDKAARNALEEHLRTLKIRALEQRDRDGYLRNLPSRDEPAAWEAEAEWAREME